MSKKYRVKGSTRRKIMMVEMKKELRSQVKKTRPEREPSAEHQAFRELEKGGE